MRIINSYLRSTKVKRFERFGWRQWGQFESHELTLDTLCRFLDTGASLTAELYNNIMTHKYMNFSFFVFESHGRKREIGGSPVEEGKWMNDVLVDDRPLLAPLQLQSHVCNPHSTLPTRDSSPSSPSPPRPRWRHQSRSGGTAPDPQASWHSQLYRSRSRALHTQ